MLLRSLCPLLLIALPLSAAPLQPAVDSRNIATGWRIPGGLYCDQPYVVKTDDGAWLCVMTTADGPEGSPTQKVVALRSTDHGQTWSKPLPLEKPGGPEASYAVLLKVPSGRVYCFYNHNTDNVREVRTEDGKMLKRVDSLGHYVFRFSDDHGRSWSPQRYDVPVRPFACDRSNVYAGKLRFFWNVGRPLLVRPAAPMRFWKEGDAALLTLHKVGAMGTGFFAQSEGVFLKSANLLSERDPEKIRFETLPEGEIGLRTPAGGGRIAEEQSLVQLSDGSLYCVYRSIDGHPVSTCSRDGGRTWSPPAYKTYAPGGRRFKHPRAATFVWRCGNGQYLYWFHNHAAPAAQRRAGWDPYSDRNPVWVCAGREQDSPAGKVLVWSQPEILLYDDDPFVRMSYPDLIEDGGEYYITETQKHLGRVHHIDRALLDGLFAGWQRRQVARTGLLLDYPGQDGKRAETVAAPKLPPLLTRDSRHEDGRVRDLRAGFSLEVGFHRIRMSAAATLLDCPGAGGAGYRLTAERDGSLRLWLSDGRTEAAWSSDAGLVQPGKTHHVVVIVDGGPKIIRFVVDGVLCDGGEERQFGWGRFSPHFRGPAGGPRLHVGAEVKQLRVYGRALRTFEAVGNHRAVGEPAP